jgi:murein DD-endopeptidase MepM/ murein hydrolase activator NlpD
VKLARILCVLTVLWLLTAAVVQADQATPAAADATVVSEDTPVPVPVVTEPPATSPPVIVPTAAPTVAPPVVEPTSPPISVSREHSTPIATVSQPVLPESTPGPETYPTSPVHPSGTGSHPGPTASTGSPSTSGSSGTISAQPSPPGITEPPPSTTSSVNVTAPVTSAQAPAELSCRGKSHPVSGPFLVSPYSGWTELFSFVDHDSPDYTVDGTIVLANGLTASAGNGQASDLFPAYWSPSLRQYVNYDGHNGYDFGITYQPVLAAAAGTVKFAGWTDGGYGEMILIDHHNGYVTLYGHLSKLEVKAGDQVDSGQEIGISGSTGRSSGPHLHFSVFHDCHVTDPYGWTGTGTDPLQHFDGEQAGYLWLPGHDPLLLNPPPNWPAYPLGLHISLPPEARTSIADRRIPPVDRLLLLALPGPAEGTAVNPETALARTEARISEEAEALVPELNELRTQGLIDSYQLIPAAAAIWVHGTASAGELEALEGIASLSGTEPHDLAAAQAGLAHAVLIQMAQQQAPSLWPVGFRSGLHAWRPAVTVLDGSPLVAGFALPGRPVVVSLHRGASVSAAVRVTGDPQTGGFVAMLQRIDGTPATVRPGDVVECESSGRDARVPIHAISIRAKRPRISGLGPADATISLSAAVSARRTWTGVLSSDRSGSFVRRAPSGLVAGSLIVAGIADAAGNREAAATFVPGVIATVGSAILRGWSVSHNPHLWLVRGGQILARQPLHLAADGTFETELRAAGRPLLLQPGDIIRLGSPLHHRQIAIPPLTAALSGPAGHIRLRGPRAARIRLSFASATRGSWSRVERLDGNGAADLPLPSGAVAAGDRITASYVLASGDTLVATDEARGIVVHQGSSTIDGRARPNTVLTIRAFDGAGRLIGSAATNTRLSGDFHLSLTNAAGRTVRLLATRRLAVHEAHDTIAYTLPAVSVQLSGSRVLMHGPPHQQLVVTRIYAGHHRQTTRLFTDGAGGAAMRLPTGEHRLLERVVVGWSNTQGLTIQRVAVVHRVAVSAAAARCAHVVRSSRRASACRSGAR